MNPMSVGVSECHLVYQLVRAVSSDRFLSVLLPTDVAVQGLCMALRTD